MASISAIFTAHYDLDSYAQRILPGAGGVRVVVSKDEERAEATAGSEYAAAIAACAALGLDVDPPPSLDAGGEEDPTPPAPIYARLAGGNLFTGLQAIDVAALPLHTMGALAGGAELTIVQGVYRGETLVSGIGAARLDLSGIGGPPSKTVAVLVRANPSGNGTYLIDLIGPGAPGEPNRVVTATVPNLQILPLLLGTYTRANVVTGDPSFTYDAAPKTYVDRLAKFGFSALFRSIETAGTLPRFQMCGDIDLPNNWERGSWTTPAPADFTDGLWIRSYGVTISTDGLPTDPGEQMAFYELWSWPKPVGGANTILGAWDTGEFASRGTWLEDEQRWKWELFWEHSTSDAIAPDEDVRFVGDHELPADVRIASLAVWVERDKGDGNGRVRMFMEVPAEVADIYLDGAHFLTLGTLDLDGPCDISSSTEAWRMGSGYGRCYQERMEVRNVGPDGPLMASPDAAAADLEADGDPFDDGQSNPWTPQGAEAVVVPAA